MVLTAGLIFLLAEALIGIVLAFLPWSRIKNWFSQKEAKILDEDHLRITLHEKLRDGKHRVVYGIFNNKTSQFLEGESVTTEEIDSEIASYHEGNALVVYT